MGEFIHRYKAKLLVRYFARKKQGNREKDHKATDFTKMRPNLSYNLHKLSGSLSSIDQNNRNWWERIEGDLEPAGVPSDSSD